MEHGQMATIIYQPELIGKGLLLPLVNDTRKNTKKQISPCQYCSPMIALVVLAIQIIQRK